MLVVRDNRERMLALQLQTPPSIAWANADAAYRRMDELDETLDPDAPERDRPAFHLQHIPAPELRIDDPSFALDMFFIGLWFVSARMRAALGLQDDAAVFRAAEVSGAARVRERGYAAFAPLHHLDGIDPDRSDIERLGEGPGSSWRLAAGGATPPRVSLRHDRPAPAPLFYMDRTDWLMITREAADRVRAAGINEVFFDAPTPAYGSWMTAAA